MSKRSQTVVKQARIRDNHTCQKCGRRQGDLHVHRIVPLDEGGSDTLENVTVLCAACHLEWESMYKAFDYAEWLTFPPAWTVLKALTKPELWPEGLSAVDFRLGLIASGEMLRDLRRLEPRDGAPDNEEDE